MGTGPDEAGHEHVAPGRRSLKRNAAVELSLETLWPEAQGQCERLYEAAHVFTTATFFVAQRKRAQAWVRSRPFFIGASLRNSEGTRRVYWLSQGDDPSLFADLNLTAVWTPIGRLILRHKDQLKDGIRRSASIRANSAWVGVPAGFVWEVTGLVADVDVRQGAGHAEVQGALAWLIDDNGKPYTRTVQSPSEVAPAVDGSRRSVRTGFGLGDVVGSLDGFQLDNIDFDGDGILIVTGAAGTGNPGGRVSFRT